ncbi:MAG: hypothetical protein WCK70_10575 [Chloroflexales bacterium]
MRPDLPLWYTFSRHLRTSSSRYSEYLIAGLTPDRRAALSDSAAADRGTLELMLLGDLRPIDDC